jgi:hypothetical protein
MGDIDVKTKQVWFVSRQHYWGVDDDDARVVEIAYGGLDYANADMLTRKYKGEGYEYADPREAVKVAFAIMIQWRGDDLNNAERIHLAHGFTAGYTMPMEATTYAEAMEWATKTLESLPKCDMCGDVIEERWTSIYAPMDEVYCSLYCAERRAVEYDMMTDE